MGAKSSSEWTDASWSPIRARNLKTGKIGWYCEHATTGCEFCYAESMNKRLGTGLPFKPGHRKDVEIFLDRHMLLEPARWKKSRMIFVCSMTDLFADFVQDEWIDQIFSVMGCCPQHTFQVPTKRPERMREYCDKFGVQADLAEMYGVGEATSRLVDWPLKNVWLGVSAERQQEADERIPHLLQTPAAIRFVSLEPLLGPIDLTHIRYSDEITFNVLRGPNKLPFGHFDGATLDWVIVGGESGPKARNHDIELSRSIIAQCKSAGVAVFEKQLGSRPIGKAARSLNLKDRKGGDWSEWPEDLRIREMPEVHHA